MENIPNIEIRPISIRPIRSMDIPKYVMSPSQSIPTAAPVTVNLGVPIVNLPGCVESNKEQNPKNTALLQDDPNGTLTFCDASLPSYNPIDFNAEDYLQPSKAPVPPYKPSETNFTSPQIEVPIIPKTEIPITKTEEKEVIIQEENISIIDYLPSTDAIISTTVIAAAAGTSALVARPLANLLLKIIRPIMKKIIKKVSTNFGKEEILLSVEERREIQREKTEAVRAIRKLRGR
tara:strand:- start:1534 stop:2235 length:702 start_codon:yes stop_codon:yes gene_type:complete